MTGVGSPVDSEPDCLPGVESVGSFDMAIPRLYVYTRVSCIWGTPYASQLIVDFQTRTDSRHVKQQYLARLLQIKKIYKYWNCAGIVLYMHTSSIMSAPTPEAGPSTRPRRPHPHPERVYTGPDPSTLSEPRSRTQADKYFARVANDNILPNRYSKALGFGGWFFGGGQLALTYESIKLMNQCL